MAELKVIVDDEGNELDVVLEEKIEIDGGSGVGGLTEEQVREIVRETAVTKESDPTVPDWAKQAKKPTYSYNEITDKPDYDKQLENLGKYAVEINDKLNGTNDLVDSFNHDLSDLTDKTDELEEYSIRDVSLGILEDNELSVELKDKEGNVIASAETTLPMPDLTDYVKNTDYATDNKAGAIKTSRLFGLQVTTDGNAIGRALSLNEYQSWTNAGIIAKGTLENIKHNYVKEGITTNTETLTDDEKASACEWLGAMPIVKPPAAYWTYFLTIGKDESGKIEYDLRDFNELANKEYVDNLVGGIESVLTAILGV